MATSITHPAIHIILATAIIPILWSDQALALTKNRFVNKQGMKFVYIPPGTFFMGSPETEEGRKRRGKANKARRIRKPLRL